MLSYTKATLKAALLSWNRNSDPEFEGELDDIIKRGELNLMRALDLAPMLSSNDTTTAATTTEVFKPLNLLRETAVWIWVDDVRVPLLKRNPSFLKFQTQTDGVPEFYAEKDTTRWDVSPPADDAYLIEVDGEYAPESLVDGNDDETSYFSTTFPDLLYVACAIEATEFLKFWTHKDALLAEFTTKVAMLRGDNANMEKTDAEDIVSDRQQQNPVKAPGA